MNATIRIFEPVAPRQRAQPQPRHPLDGLTGKTIGFIDNAKPNFGHLVDDLAELLVSKHGVAAVIKRRKRSSAVRAPDSVMQEISAQCDAVITGSGD